MKFIQATIPDLIIMQPTVYEDERGWFMESFNEKGFQQELKRLNLPIPGRFVQDNQSCSKKGVLRGLHYQIAPYAQGKLVRVVQGAIFDVAVDIRKNSKTFGQAVGVELSAENRKIFWIPEGFAHGFITLEDHTQVIYKTTNFYHKASERSISWCDPDLKINWPFAQPILSEKDKEANQFSAIEYF